MRSGAYRTPIPFSFVVGRDLVGVVSEPGSAALGFEPGELVWCNSLGHAGRQGAAAEYAGGRILLLAGLRAQSELPVGELYRRDGRVAGFVISNASVAELSSAAARINQLLEGDAIAPRRIEVLPLSAAGEAHRRLEAGQARGTRLVLIPAEGVA